MTTKAHFTPADIAAKPAIAALNPDLCAKSPATPATAPAKTRKARVPTKTEAEYRRTFLDRRADACGVHFEGLTFRMANGHRYTPDFVLVTVDGIVEAHEVKGGYRLHTYGRSRLAFDQARTEFVGVKFRWAEKTAEGWRVE